MTAKVDDRATPEEIGKMLQPRESMVPSTETEQVGTGGEFDASDLALPYVKIVQATSESGTPGQLWFSDGTPEADVINLVVLHIQFTRSLFDSDRSASLCSSNDRVIGNVREPDELLIAAGANVGTLACGGCPHQDDPQFGKGLLCKKDYALTCINIDTNEPFLFRVKGSAMGVFRYRLISAVAMGRKAPWFAAFEMTVDRKTNTNKQSWFAPELMLIKLYSVEEQAAWAALAGQYAHKQEAEPSFGVDADDLPFE